MRPTRRQWALVCLLLVATSLALAQTARLFGAIGGGGRAAAADEPVLAASSDRLPPVSAAPARLLAASSVGASAGAAAGGADHPLSDTAADPPLLAASGVIGGGHSDGSSPVGASSSDHPLSANPALAAGLRRDFCAPPGSRDHLDYTALAWQWAARLLDVPSAAPGGLSAAQSAAVTTFYSFHAGIALLRPGPPTTRCCMYHRIYKAGNQLQMNEIAAWNSNWTPRMMLMPETVRHMERLGGFSFTWTREPLDRFLSGYGEILYRTMPGTLAYPENDALKEEARTAARRDAGITFLDMPAGSRDRFAAFLRNVLAGALIHEVEHVYSAAPVFFVAQRVGLELFVGKLEAASHDADVRRMHERCGVAPVKVEGHQYGDVHGTQFGSSLRDTPIADDIAAARSALERDSRLLEALCLLLLPDYSCADYLPPTGCRAVLQQFNGAVADMRKNRGYFWL